MILLNGLALSVLGCTGTTPLSVFFSPNPDFEASTTRVAAAPRQETVTYPTITAAVTPIPQTYTTSPQITYGVLSQQPIITSDHYLMTQDQMAIQQSGYITSRLSEALAEAQAHIHAGQSRLQEKSLLEAVREFELARQLVEEQVDPSLQYVQQYPKVQGGVSILSNVEIQSLQRRRTAILDSINRAYDVNTLFNNFQQQQQVDTLRAQNKTVLQPVLLSQGASFPQGVRASSAVSQATQISTDIHLDLPWEEAGPHITRFRQHAHAFQTYLLRADQYFPAVSALLSAQGVTDDLAYLALLESGFQPAVEDPSGRAGLWQLSRTVAQKYGLTVSSGRDERKDLEASTRAFARYMSYLRNRFGSWELAILAYEMGEERLQRVIHQAGSYNLQTVRNQLGTSSQEGAFLAKLAAVVLIAQNPRAYGFSMDLPTISGQSAITQTGQPKIAVMNEPPAAILYTQP